MHRIIAPDNSPTKPPAPTGTQGFAVLGTIAPPEWHNSVQDEIINACALRSIAPDPADDGQLADLLRPNLYVLFGVDGAATPATMTNQWPRAQMVSAVCKVGGDKALIAASEGIESAGDFAVVLATSGGTADEVIGSDAVNAAVIACDVGIAGVYVGGESSAAMAAEGSRVENAAERSAALASLGGTTTGAQTAIIAATQAQISRGSAGTSTGNAAIIAADFGRILSNGKGNGIFASAAGDDLGGLEINAAAKGAAIVACTEPVSVGSNNALVAASADVTIASGKARCAVLASGEATLDANEALIAATNDCDILAGGNWGAIIGSTESAIENRQRSAIIASDRSTVQSAGENNFVVISSLRCKTSLSAASSSHQVGGGADPSADTGPKWRLDSGSGGVFGSVAYSSSGADYAEFFQNLEAGVIPIGRLVSRVKRRVKLGQAGDRPLGVVSAAPSVVGNDDALGWRGQWQRGEFGEVLWQTTELEDGGTIRHQIRSPDWDPELAVDHRPRSERPEEWTIVALTGQVLCAVGPDVADDDWLTCGADGIGVTSETPTSIEVMEIVTPFDSAKGYAVAAVLIR